MKKVLVVVGLVAVVLAGVYVAEKRYGQGGPAGTGDQNIVDLKGKPLDMEPYKGKVVLVNFWATWCSPCRVEIPWFIEFEEKYGEKGFVVLGVAMDEGIADVGPYVQNERFDVNGQKRAVNYRMFLGDDAAAQAFGGILGMPTSVLIARDGTVVKKIIGLVNHDYLQAEIEKLL